MLGKFSSVHRTSVSHVDLDQSQIGDAQGLRVSILTDLAFSLITSHSNHRKTAVDDLAANQAWRSIFRVNRHKSIYDR